jgi:succinate dehydrogenase / fumarate reductase iron-sulfur subunit
MRVIFSVKRFDPATGAQAHLQSYEIEADPRERVLDGLLYIKDNLDGTLGFRRSCAHGVCGSDGMIINGVERLACKTLLRDVTEKAGDVVTLEPLRHLKVERDLMVDQDEFFAKYRDAKPYFVPPVGESAEKERLQSPAEREAFDDATACILCASCYSACPVLDSNGRFLGPAAIVQAARFNLDSRDAGWEERARTLNGPDGVWPCESHFQCTRVCPRGIKVTKNINLTKRLLKSRIPGSGPGTSAS